MRRSQRSNAGVNTKRSRDELYGEEEWEADQENFSPNKRRLSSPEWQQVDAPLVDAAAAASTTAVPVAVLVVSPEEAESADAAAMHANVVTPDEWSALEALSSLSGEPSAVTGCASNAAAGAGAASDMEVD